jgi:hypothetical protein
MQGLMRLVCIGYLIFLTALLLTKNPLWLVGVRGDAPALLRFIIPVAHLLSFGVLAVLALMARWPMPRWGITVLLLLYAGMTEVAQSFLPPRTAEWGDWLQDLAGIAAGAVLCWIVAMAAGIFVGSKHKSEQYVSAGTSDEWEVVRNVMSRPAARSQSWWG